MKIYKKAWIAVFFVCAAASSAHAQVAELGVSGGPMRINSKELGQGYSLDDGWKLGFRLTLNSWTMFGQEVGYSYNRTKLLLGSGASQQSSGMAIHQGSYNLLAYATPEGKAVRPFVTGGGQFNNFVPPGQSATQGGGDMKFGINYGGGVKVKVTERYQVRFDARQFSSPKPFGELRETSTQNVGGWLRMTELSVGFAFTL